MLTNQFAHRFNLVVVEDDEAQANQVGDGVFDFVGRLALFERFLVLACKLLDRFFAILNSASDRHDLMPMGQKRA